MTRFLIFTFSLLMLFAFKCEREFMFSLNEAFVIKIGQEYVNLDIPAEIEVAEVVEDSRCPKNVDCVWAGQVKIKFSLETKEEEAQNLVLTLRDDRPEEDKKVINGYSYQLLSVYPYPEAGKKIEPHDYIIELVIKKSEAPDTDAKM